MLSPLLAEPPLTAYLDVASSKVACVLANAAGEIAGMSCSGSAGITSGLVNNPALAHGAIAKAIVEAEDDARARASTVVLAINGGAVTLNRLSADIGLDPPIVTEASVAAVRSSLLEHATHGMRTIIHAGALRFRLDGRACAAVPLQRFGRRLDVDFDAVTADTAALQRLIGAVEATGVPVARVVPGGIAATYAVTSKAERMTAVAVVDLGAALTTVTTFANGRPALATGIALGSGHVIAELDARLQGSPINQRRISDERAISLIAHADAAQILGFSGFERATPDVSGSSAAAPSSAGASATDISSLERLLRLIADRLDLPAAGLAATSPVVLTGGGSRLKGLAAVAGWLWDRPVRLGQAFQSHVSAPEFAVVAGLMAARDAGIGVAFEVRAGQGRRVA